MTTKEHIRALEQQCKELRAHIDKLESEPETLYRQLGETIQQERQWRRKAEARAEALRGALDDAHMDRDAAILSTMAEFEEMREHLDEAETQLAEAKRNPGFISVALDDWQRRLAREGRMRAALEKVEWVLDANYLKHCSECAWCQCREDSGHADDCARQAALNPEPSPPSSVNMPPCNDSYHLTNRAADTEGGTK